MFELAFKVITISLIDYSTDSSVLFSYDSGKISHKKRLHIKNVERSYQYVTSD